MSRCCCDPCAPCSCSQREPERREESTDYTSAGLWSGILIGACLGGPLGACIGGLAGGMLGVYCEEDDKKKRDGD